jgi:hypothetical protein
MKEFKLFVAKIETAALRGEINSNLDFHIAAKSMLNGQVSKVFRSTVPLDNRREHGIFFTNEKLAQTVTHKFISDFNRKSLIADPACGTGDLLIACANKLPVSSTLKKTLHIWGNHLLGFDIFPEFIRASKARLILLAKFRTNSLNSRIEDIDDYFPLIKVQDFLKDSSGIEKASHIILNPPYNKTSAPDDCLWANKNTSAASLFMDICISKVASNAKIRAILPDVLRAGSSYLKWREHIESLSKKMDVTIYGQFDEWTDIDVFTLRLQKAIYKKKPSNNKWTISTDSDNILGSYFDVYVGPVVPHRDPKKGPKWAYIHAKTVGMWKEMERISESRKYNGTVFTPPFVVVRRTSRPGNERAIGTIIKGKRRVAIENHLVVLLPQKKTLGECRNLLKILKSPKTDEWLNQRMRCRHLTVEAMKELPYGDQYGR